MSDISRRKFIQLTVLGGAVASAGCDLKDHSRYDSRIYRAEVTGQYGGYDNRVLPYVNQPDGLQDGVPQYFATVCAMCPAGCGLYVRTMGGRAHNVQGNPDHPVSGGKVCSRGVASLQNLYNVDRLRFPSVRPAKGSAPVRSDWETVLTRTAAALGGARGRVAILADAVTVERQPTLSGLVSQFAKSVGGRVYSYGLLDDAAWRAASKAVYGRDQVPAYALGEADYLLAFGSDFLDAGPSQVYYNRLFGEFRQGPRRTQGQHGKFVYIGPRMNATAAKADVWLPCEPGTEGLVAQAILGALGGAAVDAGGLTAAQIAGVARDWTAAGTRALAIGGGTVLPQASAVQTMTAIENLNVQARSACVGFGTPALPVALSAGSYHAQMARLLAEMQAGRVSALITVGQVNPAFTLPAAMGWVQAVSKVPFVASITPFEDETTASATVLLPARAALEDWGDDIPAVIPPGVTMASLRQPVIDPQFITDAPGLSPENFTHDVVPWMDTRGTGDILIDLARRLGHPLGPVDMRDAVRRTWAKLGQANINAPGTNEDPVWVNALSQGGFWKQGTVTSAVGRSVAVTVPPAPETGFPDNRYEAFALHLFTHSYWWDGRHANLGWMQEHPDPMSMAVWNSWVEINAEVAHRLGIRTGDWVRVSTPYGTVEAPALPSPALHPGVVAMPIGQGHTAYGRTATGRGANPLAMLAGLLADGTQSFGANYVHIAKVRDAKSGYNGTETLVLPQDRPDGGEPDAVKDLIHTTAKEWKQAKPVTGAPQAEGSIFHRAGTVVSPGEGNPGE